MKVKVTLKNGIETILNDVRVIKPLVNEPQVIIVYKDVCQFEYIDCLLYTSPSPRDA